MMAKKVCLHLFAGEAGSSSRANKILSVYAENATVGRKQARKLFLSLFKTAVIDRCENKTRKKWFITFALGMLIGSHYVTPGARSSGDFLLQK